MKLLFLDIDGVLNSARSMTVTDSSMPREDPTDVRFDPIAVGLLKELCQVCDLQIFVHSSWWGGRVNKKYLTAAFRHYGWKRPRIIGGASAGNRVDRIHAGLKEHKPAKFVILDDADLRRYFHGNAILVDQRNGLSFQNYAEVLTLFDKEPGVFLI